MQTPDHLKTCTGEEAFNKNGLSQRTIRLLKDKFPDLEVRVLTGAQGLVTASVGPGVLRAQQRQTAANLTGPWLSRLGPSKRGAYTAIAKR